MGPEEDVQLLVPANDDLGTPRLRQRLQEEGGSERFSEEVLFLSFVGVS